MKQFLSRLQIFENNDKNFNKVQKVQKQVLQQIKIQTVIRNKNWWGLPPP
jgi:hypothetical protein